jgi:hypothetical protein
MLDSSSCVAPIGQPSSLSNRRQGFENWFDRGRPFSDKGPRDIMRRERPCAADKIFDMAVTCSGNDFGQGKRISETAVAGISPRSSVCGIETASPGACNSGRSQCTRPFSSSAAPLSIKCNKATEHVLFSQVGRPTKSLCS